MTPQDFETEAASLSLPEFSEETALRLGLTVVNMAKLDKLPIVVNIRTQDRTLFHAALPGSAPLNDNWARRKSNTAFAFRKASFHAQAVMKAKDEDLSKHGLNSTDYAPQGGAVPICVKGAGMVACLTVSGLPQADDHALAVRAIRTLLPD
ncbi:heme-degrading domain-containing protein [Paragemmobacter straminiformis]|uniref:Heme-degrading domain-containing protein n=1 Tax=Paragemmobacter straminiformis TaxID=2045119 RepID=A0A842I872_9RHOB|nr:heme-degrading domain-containing protein [Gemmobacter straminiformis]MBC2835188.1 heme-degrading domain-containing protein [Gemmobacter straminiformis]